MLQGYLPTNENRREATLQRKRKEYADYIPRYFENIADSDRTEQEQKMLRQILVDVPRTAPNVPLFHLETVQNMLRRRVRKYKLVITGVDFPLQLIEFS